MRRILGSRGAGAVSIAAMISIFAALNGSILSGARVPFAMARDGLFFRRVGFVHPGHRTPSVSILVLTGWAALLVLTYATVAVSRIDLGRLNTIAALTIAVSKALLVVLYFMHVRYSTRLTKLVVVGGFMWLALMIGMTMVDEVTRGWIPMPPN